jgi:hypothetical protein
LFSMLAGLISLLSGKESTKFRNEVNLMLIKD